MQSLQFHWILVLIPCFLATAKMANGSVECNADERQALVDFKTRLDHNSVHKLRSWNGSNCCVWDGIECDDNTGVVVRVDLSNRGLQNRNQRTIWPALRKLKSLHYLDLSYNNFSGTIPASIGNFQQLAKLNLRHNLFNGSIPISIGNIPFLVQLDLSHNLFSGAIPASICKSHPSSIRFNLSHSSPELSLSNANRFGYVPEWSMGITWLCYLNLSFNHLDGQLPNFASTGIIYLDLSSNFLEGPFPHLYENIEVLVLSNNRLSGPIPTSIGDLILLDVLYVSNNQFSGEVPISIGNCDLEYLDLSRNNFTGTIPSTIGDLSMLGFMDLHSNNLFGEIPESIGKLSYLRSICLNTNKLSGQIPLSLQNLSGLEILDLGNNKLTGRVPSWIGEALTDLRILGLRSNSLSGEIPPLLLNMTSLQILDLSENELNGTIPASLSHLKAMAQLQHVNDKSFDANAFGYYYQVEFALNVHSMQLTYTKTLYLVTSIDLSGNHFYGEIPEDITRLVGLKVLNLSRNHISGHIPQRISELQQLLSLDLSNNNLAGSIPSGMSTMTFLETLNLSNNNLSGRIPDGNQMMTFSESSFSGNSRLCGEPIVVKCGSGNGRKDGGRISEERESASNEEYMSIGVGYAVGVLVPFMVFAVKRSWGGIYFAFVDLTVVKLSCGKYRPTVRRRRRRFH